MNSVVWCFEGRYGVEVVSYAISSVFDTSVSNVSRIFLTFFPSLILDLKRLLSESGYSGNGSNCSLSWWKNNDSV